ncbi:ABC transporter ATP-binding protein [Pseudodesulfovibrio piezophilus]|uniref:Oligopeptide transport ATP-binding protein AppF n=1 Tax=Pseudodesulfovibrio piezophilus (strain DSM 21447 / JCM 15486 / C1TLV30) TaxID=1322246 RepID=M1WLC4_PSEP2|nr:dipeptide ABC transporter ATP-binding protein [Pseudodesulfovibrio piezophilus]CCH47620.1 Oligopeptide transport ATP-binding protein AppF [Pseudodesulfovibrio piezophilus C1TLV30]
MALLELTNTHKSFKITSGLLGLQSGELRAVDNINLSVEKGKTLGLVGESGCGKSTLAKCIMGLEKLTAGEIRFEDKTINSWDEKKLRRKIQMIFQDPYSSLNPRHKVGAIIREGLDIHHIGSPKDRILKVNETLKLVGLLPEHAQRYPHEFSGGQRQRIAIARALALNPNLIVCDEPVSALDVSVQAQILTLLKDIQTQFKLTYVFISHDLSVISHIADQVAVMYLGRIMEVGPAQILFEFPRHPYTQALLSAVLAPDPEAQSQQILLNGDLPSPLAPPRGCPFHPRCPYAFEKCAVIKPELKNVDSQIQTACWLD